MITPDWLSSELNILQAHKELQESILRDITRRIIKTDFTVTETAAWQAERLQQSGMLYKDILKEISKETGKSQAEINQAFKDAHTEVFKYDESELKAAGENPKEFRYMSPQMKAVFTAALKKVTKDVKNLTGTTAVTSQSAFIRACDLAHNKIVSGAFTYQEAIKSAIKSAAKDGVSVVYPSGHISSLDAAVRRAVLSGVNQTTGTLVKMRAEETKQDLMQLSAHSGAREDHADWQGKIVSLSGRKGYLSLDDIGYGEVTGFMGAHCRHTWFIFYEDISKRAYTDEQLEAFKNETVTYEGEVIPLRQALDRQRAMERSIRRSKQELVMFDEASKNVTLPEEKLEWEREINAASVKLKSKEAKLKDFCDKAGLKRDRYREQVFAVQTENGIKNFGKSASQKAVQANKRLVDRYTKYLYNKDGSIVVTDNWIGRDIHKDPDKFKPFAVLKTLEAKGGYYQHNLTYYDSKGRKVRQIHGGHHGMPKNHKFASGGEHQHFYKYNTNGKIGWRKTKKLTKKDRRECKFIL